MEAERNDRWQSEELEQALKSYNQALLLSQRIGNHSADEARLLSKIGKLRQEIGEKAKELEAQAEGHWQHKELERALDTYNQALLLFQLIGDHSEDEARLESQIEKLRQEIAEKAEKLEAQGNDQRKHEEWGQALESYNQALRLLQLIGNHLMDEGRLLSQIDQLRQKIAEKAEEQEAEGNEYWQQRKLDLALESYNQALLLFQLIGNHSANKARLESQIETLRQEIELLRTKAIGLVTKGDDHRQREELDAALESYNEALQLFHQIGYHSVDDVMHKIRQVQEALSASAKDQERPSEDAVQPEEEALTNREILRTPISLLRRRPLLVMSISLLIVILLFTLIFTPILQMIIPRPISLQLPPGIGITQSSNSESIGISDGTFTFNGNCQTDDTLKCQAANRLRQGDINAARSLWNRELATHANDAEALIYLENQRVEGSPHITLVVATTLTGPTANLGQDNLQGAYVAQKEFNDGFKLPGLKVSLLIANFGSNPKDATTIAKQIVQAAQADKTIVGVMGLPLSSYVPDAITILQEAHLPLVSPTASSDELTGISPSFFRVVPPNDFQARVGADYAIHTLHAHTATLLSDPHDSSGANLAKDFKHSFTDLGGSADEKSYTTGESETLRSQLKDILANPPDLLYFVGPATDMNTVLMNLPPSSNLQIMGGNSLYQPQAYSAASRPRLTQLHFTAFASPDEWNRLCLNGLPQACVNPLFFTVYAQAFDDGKHQQQPYGYSRANSDTILSYDALSILLRGCQLALSQDQTSSLTPNQAQTGLKMITSAHPFQGVSGQISFGADGNPLNKVIVVLSFGSNGDVELASTNGIQGCFVIAGCANP